MKRYKTKTAGPLPTFDQWMIIGREMTKIQFWSAYYDFSFQFWGEDNNNVYVSRDSIDIADFGGEETPLDIIKRVIAWCEKTNPSVTYPAGIEVSNIQP